MTLLEQIVNRQVTTSLTATLSRTAERVADELADEILRDPTFRAQMRVLVQRAFERALSELSRPDEGGA